MPKARADNNFYQRTISDLEARERQLLAELESVRAAKRALRPLQAIQPMGVTATPNLAAMHFEMTHRPKVSFAEMARRVLVNSGSPLHIRQIVEGVQVGGLGRGKTFEEIRATLTSTLLRRPDLFVKLKRGVYGLRHQVEKA